MPFLETFTLQLIRHIIFVIVRKSVKYARHSSALKTPPGRAISGFLFFSRAPVKFKIFCINFTSELLTNALTSRVLRLVGPSAQRIQISSASTRRAALSSARDSGSLLRLAAVLAGAEQCSGLGKLTATCGCAGWR